MMLILPHLGHLPGPGADPPGPGNTERDVIQAFWPALRHELFGVSHLIPEGKTSGERRAWCAARPEESLSLEVHADVGRGHGTRIYYAPWSPRGKRAAQAIDAACITLPWPVQAIEADVDGYPSVLAALSWTKRAPAHVSGIIVELCFLDSPGDLLWLRGNAYLLAQAIVAGLRSL